MYLVTEYYKISILQPPLNSVTVCLKNFNEKNEIRLSYRKNL